MSPAVRWPGRPRWSSDGLWIWRLPVPGLHNMVMKVPPVVATAHPEAAVYSLNLLSATGTGILVAAIVAGLVMRYSPLALLRAYGRTFWVIRYSLLTIAAMLALGFVTRYSGTDATLGLAFAQTGWIYPLFGTLLGWLGVALTGSDTASNVLFGGLQKVTAQQLGLSPVLMAAANSSGGVMGKMVDAQSIVVASMRQVEAEEVDPPLLAHDNCHRLADVGLAMPGRMDSGTNISWPCSRRSRT